ncbi:MAG: hypothetical protein ACOZCL_13555 [Bacillota bacterium]
MTNGLFGFGAPVAGAAAGCGCAPVAGAVSPLGGLFCNNGFLLLLLLFILLACGGSFGINNNFFFIIILAIIAFGGFGRTFGFGASV